MSNPRHYSVEIPQRCLQLIDELWPHAEKTQQPNHPDLGPLTTTFLISMSMPIINLPVERIERHRSTRNEGYADDRYIDATLTAAVDTILSGQELRKAPFYSHGAWSYASNSDGAAFNVARSLPTDLGQQLCTKAAIAKAAKMPTSQWCSILRNAMAHGGIAYLDEHGQTSYGQPVKMYAFISGPNVKDQEQPVTLNVLRISEVNYRIFLRRWVEWLESSGLNEMAA
jgi:hypothetical protein